MVILLGVTALAIAGLVGTLVAVRRDGYRRQPPRRRDPDGSGTIGE